MKTMCHAILAALTLPFMIAPSAQAVLYLTGDANFGPNSITVDTSTGLGWLNLTEASDLSYQQVLSDTQAGGMFNGFRFATVAEVLNLYNSAGIPGTGYYPLSNLSIQSLFSLIGTSGIINGQPGALALSGTSSAGGGYFAPAIYVTGGEYLVSDGGFQSEGTAYAPTTSYPDLSSWLVKTVPEPMDAGFLVLAGAVWCGFALLRRREKAA